jgi:NAD(P)-dependent dehydrogenase (short-subunit alcohol dehydrogenase family)
LSTVLVIGAGPSLGAALEAALRGSGAVLVASRHVPQAVEASDLGAALLRDAHLLPELPPQPYPVKAAPKRWAGPILPPPRTGKRHREQRTKRNK